MRHICLNELDLSSFIKDGPDEIKNILSGNRYIDYEFVLKNYLIQIDIALSEDSGLYYTEIKIYESRTPSFNEAIHPRNHIKFQDFSIIKDVFYSGYSLGYFTSLTIEDVILKICKIVTTAYKVESLVVFL